MLDSDGQDPSSEYSANMQPGSKPLENKLPNKQTKKQTKLVKFCNNVPPEMTGGKSSMESMDPEVYAGCMSRIQYFFYWNHAHWMPKKNEHLVRIQEWSHIVTITV